MTLISIKINQKGKRGFPEEAWQELLNGKGIGYINNEQSKPWPTNIAIQPYQSYRS